MGIGFGPLDQLESVSPGDLLKKGPGKLKALRPSLGGRLARIECEIESRFGTHQTPDIQKTRLDMLFLEMRENRLREKEVEYLICEHREPKVAGGIRDEPWPFVCETLIEDEPFSGLDCTPRNIDSRITLRIEMPDEVAATAQRSTTDVEHSMVSSQTLADQEVELHLPDLVPHTANGSLRIALYAHVRMHSIGVEVVVLGVESVDSAIEEKTRQTVEERLLLAGRAIGHIQEVWQIGFRWKSGIDRVNRIAGKRDPGNRPKS